jgi:hypothetical protein
VIKVSSTGRIAKCQPTKCRTFIIIYEKIWDKAPVDIAVVNCPHRRKDNACMNCEEKLEQELFHLK